jgi:hypothetical protein
VINRRTFLRIAGLGAAPVAAGLLVRCQSFAWVADRSAAWLDAAVHSPQERLRAHFHYLDLDPPSIAQFFADLRRYRPDLSPRRPLGPSVHNLFLLSTDFFRHGCDEAQRVHYVGFYDPAITPCNNPLATFDKDSAR